MRHHTKDKGDVGVLKAQADLTVQGYLVLHPMTEHAPFDVVIYKAERFRRVQVRYRSLSADGSVKVGLRSCWNDRHGTHTRLINRQEVDLVCAYCPETDQCYYFRTDVPNRTEVWLRVRPSGNRPYRSAAIHLAENYRKVPEE